MGNTDIPISVDKSGDIPDGVVNDVKAIAESLEGREIDSPIGRDPIPLVESMSIARDEGTVVIRSKWGGSANEYDHLTESDWSPSSEVYAAFSDAGYPAPEGNPNYGVKTSRVEDWVVIEVPVVE